MPMKSHYASSPNQAQVHRRSLCCCSDIALHTLAAWMTFTLASPPRFLRFASSIFYKHLSCINLLSVEMCHGFLLYWEPLKTGSFTCHLSTPGHGGALSKSPFGQLRTPSTLSSFVSLCFVQVQSELELGATSSRDELYSALKALPNVKKISVEFGFVGHQSKRNSFCF